MLAPHAKSFRHDDEDNLLITNRLICMHDPAKIAAELPLPAINFDKYAKADALGRLVVFGAQMLFLLSIKDGECYQSV